MSEERKQLLQAKLASQKARVTDQRAREEVAEIFDCFDAAGVSFEWNPSARDVFSWTFDTFKINGYGWFDQTPEFKVIDFVYSNSDQALEVFKRLINEHGLEETARVHFLWVYGPDSVFTFTLGDVVGNNIISTLFQTDSEYWIAEENGKWCFLVHHEGTAHLAIEAR